MTFLKSSRQGLWTFEPRLSSTREADPDGFQGALMKTLVSTPLQAGPGTALVEHDNFLLANSEAYESLIEKVGEMDRRRQADAVLDRLASAAHCAAQFHPGRFADGAIENLALEIGAGLHDLVAEDGGFTLPAAREESRRRVLHVASHVVGIGGHTRMLHHWVQNDRSSSHSLVILNQRDIPVPHWLSEAVRNSGGDLVVFASRAPLCQKAKWLRGTARRIADLVVLHHDFNDVVPTVAFAVDECPPVVLLNHADHHFWLGSSVSDMVINLRTAGAEHTAKRRYVLSNVVLPIPLVDSIQKVSRREARRALSIPEDQVVLLSIGRAEKYRPCGPYDFVETAAKILNRQTCAHLYVVGESSAGIAPYLRGVMHKRLHLVGSMEDPSLYRAAADIYLESFPFGSTTALLEAALSGLPVVPAYAPLFPLLVANDDAIQDLLKNPASEQEYIDRVDLLIRQADQRAQLGGTLRKRLLVDHVGNGWLDRLAALYVETDRLRHNPRAIPVSSCSSTAADISLSRWHVMSHGQTKSDASGDILGPVLRHRAFVARYFGDYAKARRYAWHALRQDPNRWATWRLLIIAILGRGGKLIKLMLRPAPPYINAKWLFHRTITRGTSDQPPDHGTLRL
jgi:glycosyltransferase involved in cell wall biosynthesis